MTTDTTTITVTVEIGDREYVRQVQGARWRRDDNDRLYIYDDNDEVILEVEGDYVVEIMREAKVETIATIDS